jgi:glycosyltransferase involved in cell wall biosynthesis
MLDSEQGLGERPLCLLPKLSGIGGTASFQWNMQRGLSERGIPTTFSIADADIDTALIVGGTRDLVGLWRAKRRGVRLFQRLDGMNWIHRKRRTGLGHYLKAERANLLLSWTRKNLATGVIYQSHFVHRWWESVYGPTGIQHAVVHNGVDLERCSPDGSNEGPTDALRILVVEGRLAGGYELGLEHAVEFASRLAQLHPGSIELMIVGQAADSVKRTAQSKSSVPLRWEGLVSRERVPFLDRSAHLFFAADIHPACPNAVIEALACGLPVVGFDTGALKEIVDERSGCIVPYGSDPWNLEPPDFDALAQAALSILQDPAKFRIGARRRAEEKFGLDGMVDGYLEAMGW